MLSSVGTTLNSFSLCSLFIGIIYIVWGEYEELNLKKKKMER
jgi:hypothetical protein